MSVPAPPVIVSLPAPPVIVSLPPPPSSTLSLASPVRVSAWFEPVIRSMLESVSLPSPPVAVLLAKLTTTADVAFA